MTLREWFRALVAAKERTEETRDRDLSLAWHIAALTRGTKGLPPLDRLLTRRGRASARQTPQEQIAMWQVAAARFGGAFRPLDPTTVVINRG